MGTNSTDNNNMYTKTIITMCVNKLQYNKILRYYFVISNNTIFSNIIIQFYNLFWPYAVLIKFIWLNVLYKYMTYYVEGSKAVRPMEFHSL